MLSAPLSYLEFDLAELVVRLETEMSENVDHKYSDSYPADEGLVSFTTYYFTCKGLQYKSKQDAYNFIKHLKIIHSLIFKGSLRYYKCQVEKAS